jgi:hypothetical protein
MSYSPMDLRNARVKQALRHPALEGCRRINRGHFCAVFAKPWSDTVLKATTDQFQYWFYADGTRPQGPFFPRLVEDHGEIGTTEHNGDEVSIYLVEMERLQPIGRDAPPVARHQSKLLRQALEGPLGDDYWHASYRERAYKRLSKAVENEALPAEMCEALGDLRNFVANYDERIALDIHSKNLMRRGSQIVINDPFCDSKYT